MNKILLNSLFLAMMILGFAGAQSTTPSNSVPTSVITVACQAYNQTVVGYEGPIEGLIIVVSLMIIAYEGWQSVHMKHLAKEGQGGANEDELAKYTSHAISIIFVMIIILVAVVGGFTVMTNMVC